MSFAAVLALDGAYRLGGEPLVEKILDGAWMRKVELAEYPDGEYDEEEVEEIRQSGVTISHLLDGEGEYMRFHADGERIVADDPDIEACLMAAIRHRAPDCESWPLQIGVGDVLALDPGTAE
jgi:hypothetical protein